MALNPVIAAALGIDPNSLPGGYNYGAGGQANFSGINPLDLIHQYQQDQALPAYNGDGEAGLSAMQARQGLSFGNGQNGQSSWGYGGYDVIPLPNGGYGIAKGTAGAQNGTGYGIYGEQPMDVYDASGKFTGTGMTPKGLNPNDDSMKQFMIGAGFMAPMWLAATGALGAGAGAAGGSGAGGTAASFSGQSLGGMGMESGVLGAGGGLDPALAAAMSGGAAAGSSVLPSILGNSKLLGLGATALGGLLGSKGVDNKSTQTSQMDPRMDPYVYGSLLPMAQQTLNAQYPGAQQTATNLNSVGTQLLNTPTTPDFNSNPYMKAMADDMQRRTSDLLGQNNLAIQGNSVAAGGLGGSRQGVAQGIAASKAADSLQGNLANLYGNQYNLDSDRALRSVMLGSGLLSQGQETAWAPLNNASNVFKPYTNLNSAVTSSTQQGGGMMGALGGALGGAQIGKTMGWW